MKSEHEQGEDYRGYDDREKYVVEARASRAPRERRGRRNPAGQYARRIPATSWTGAGVAMTSVMPLAKRAAKSIPFKTGNLIRISKISQIACHDNTIRDEGIVSGPGLIPDIALPHGNEYTLAATMDKKLVQKIRKNVPGKVLPGEPLARHTTYRVGGKAEILVCPRDADDAARVYSFVKREGVPARRHRSGIERHCAR